MQRPDPLSAPPSPASPDAPATLAAGRRLCAVVSGLHARGWAPGTGGNFSVTLDTRPLRLLITQSGRDKGKLSPTADLVVVDGDGRPADGAVGRPSAETLLHCAIVEERGAGSVLHTHSVGATLLGEHHLPAGGFTLRDLEAAGDTLFMPVFANTQDMVALAADVRRLLAERPDVAGFLLAGHGLYTWGESLEVAQRQVEVLEESFASLARKTRFASFEIEHARELLSGDDPAFFAGELGDAVDAAETEPLVHATIAAVTGAAATRRIGSPTAALLGERFLARGGITIKGYEMLKGLEGITTHEAEVHVPVLAPTRDRPGMSERVRSLLDRKPDVRAFFLAGQGLFTWGRTAEQAQRHVEVLEFLLECVGRRTPLEPVRAMPAMTA